MVDFNKYLTKVFKVYKVVHQSLICIGIAFLPAVKVVNILKPNSNRSPYIFTLVQKMKHRVYKIYAFFLNDSVLCRDTASYFI